MSDKKANTRVAIDQLIASRWSPRAFDANKPVEDEKIMALLEAARWAPSCFGEQPWRYVVCNKFRDEVNWQLALSCLVEKNQLWAKNAPVLMLASANAQFSHNGNDNQWAQYDTGAASENMCLQAASIGLFVHQMGGFDAERAHELLKVPRTATPMAMLAVGYEGAISDLHEDFVEGEKAERERHEISELFFNGEWGKSYDG